MLGQAACPRCGATVRGPEARFCARCGITLPWAGSAPPGGRAAPPRVPPVVTRPVVPPPGVAVIPSTYPPPYGPAGPVPAGRRPNASRGRSGCGCLLMVLALVVGLVALGRSGTRPRARPAEHATVVVPAPLVVTAAAPGLLPDRPAFPFQPLPRSESYRAPGIRDAVVVRHPDDGDAAPHRLRAIVRPGGRPRTLLVAYLVGPDGTTLADESAGSAAGRGAAAVGAWIDDPDRGRDWDRDRDDARDLSAHVDLPMPTGLDPELLRKASVQVSLFDDRMAEVARVKVSLPPPSRSRSSGESRNPWRGR